MHIFEDGEKNKLLPLVYLHHVSDLRCGILTLKEKIEQSLGRLSSKYSIFINGRLLVDNSIISLIKKIQGPCIFIKDKNVVAAVIAENEAGAFKEKVFLTLSDFESFGLPIKEIEANLISYPWDLIYKNSDEIKADIKRLKLKPVTNPKKIKDVFFVNNKEIYIGKNCKIKPGVVLDAEEGPIVIDDNTAILANSVIMGPSYIGKGSIIKAGSKIYGGTTIGPMCKIGGEVEGSIFHGFANKQHDGFIGHSYIGEWVNLGAGTNNSDLKNNYSTVKIHNDGKIIDTGLLFMGLVMGDHSRSGIGTTFNTGTVIGISSNIFGEGFHPKFIPSFSWGGLNNSTEYNLEKAIETAKAVMKRRNVEMDQEYERRFRQVFEETKAARSSLL